MAQPPGATCTVSTAIGTYTSANVSLNGLLTVNQPASAIGFGRTGSKNGFRAGSAATGGSGPATGFVEQTAGAVTASNVYLGYYGTMATVGTGTYTISGESTLTITNDPVTSGRHMGGLSVGSGANESAAGQQTVGRFVVIGPQPVISVTSLVVGGDVTNNGGINKGTLEFQLGSGVSSIGCTSVTLDFGGDYTTADLVVSLTNETAPPPIIVLAVNDAADGVSGTFDTVSGDKTTKTRAEEGDMVILSTPMGTKYRYNMSYTYNAETGRFGTGNDIALVPEPATIALFGLGLLAVVRRPRRK